MSRIFLSHSSANNTEAIALRDWLKDQGWDDVFLDLDPERGLKAGERWQAALKSAVERCELVIFVVSPAWAISKWCVAEYLLAKNLNKSIFGVLVEPTPLSELPLELTSEWQLVDLTRGELDYVRTIDSPLGSGKVAFSEAELRRLQIGLMYAGLDPRFFAWPPKGDPERSPYRGLRPLEEEDAGIFFGRDGSVIPALDMLRGLRALASPQLLVILGASGSGKSSFMRAGLLPRMTRENHHFLTLPVIRPERSAISGETGLVTCLEKALSGRHKHTRAELRKVVENGLASVLAVLREIQSSKILPPLSIASAKKPPTLILPVDQAEELFTMEGAVESSTFLSLIAGLAREENLSLIVLFTIRSDAYDRLQSSNELSGVRQHTLSLPPMPRGSYADVIKGPARRLDACNRSLKIEDSLVDALLSDVEAGAAKDALPLLAFTLERLYREHGSDGDLKLSEYEQFGRVKGSIVAAVDQALKNADSDHRIPRAQEDRIRLLRHGLIPWLAGIDPDTGTPRRRVARLSEIPTSSRPLIDQLVEQRLLATDVAKDTGETTIEPAHEALLRQWGLLQSWLSEDAALLALIEGVRRASRDWIDNATHSAWLVHSGSRLIAAQKISERIDLASSLTIIDRNYLSACETRSRISGRRKKVLGVFVVAVAAIGYLAYDELSLRRELIRVADRLNVDGRSIEAAPFAVAASAPQHSAVNYLELPKAKEVLRNTGFIFKLRTAIVDRSVNKEALNQLGTRLLIKNYEDEVSLIDTFSGHKILNLGVVVSWALSDSGRYASIKFPDRSLSIVDLDTGQQTTIAKAGEAKGVYHNKATDQIVTVADDNSCNLHPDISSSIVVNIGNPGTCRGATLFEEPQVALVKYFDRTGALWSKTGEKIVGFDGCDFCDLSKDGRFIYAHDGPNIVITTTADGARTAINVSPLSFDVAYFGARGKRLITRDTSNNVAIWDTATGNNIANLGRYLRVEVGPKQEYLLTSGEDNSGSLWQIEDASKVIDFSPGDLESTKFSKNDDLLIRTHAGRISFIQRGRPPKDLPAVENAWGTALAPDATRISVASRSEPGYIWDVLNWRKVTDFDKIGRDAGPEGLFSPDGKRYVAQSSDNEGTVWNTETGEMLGILGSMPEVVISKDASTIVTVSNSRAAVWTVKSPAAAHDEKGLRAFVCRLNADYLTLAPNVADEQGLSNLLIGRPPNPCDWEGLLSLKGWQQFFEQWRLRLRTAFGVI